MRKFLLFTVVVLFAQLAKASNPTWAQDVAPILYAHCTSCHNPGSIAPFSLLTYSDAYTHASLINNDLTQGIMPPWPPDTAYSRFLHERILSASEIALIEQWTTNGKAEGNIALAPSQPTYATGSQLGTVSLSVQIPTYTVSGTGDVYRNFPIASGLAQDMYVTALEVVPGNASIVHHVLVYQDTTNVPATKDASDPGPGYTDAGGTGSNASVLLNGWAPGATPYYTPVGTGFRLPAHTNIVVQVHYPNGSQGQSDSTRINFTLTPIAQRNISVQPILNYISDMTNGPINIPANTTKTYYEKYTLPATVTVLGVFPHMHLVGKSIKSWAIPTAGDTVPLINIPNWNFHWQGTYVFPNALRIPSGTSLQASAYYDNTANNPNNPNTPPQTVTAGEATTNEMMVVFFSYLSYQSGDTNIIIDRRVIPQGATNFCSGQSVSLQTIIGARYTYQWYKNGASITGATGATYVASQPGNYYVHIALGPNITYSDTVAVSLISTAPTAVVTPGSATLCTGQSATLNATTGNNYTYQWFLDTVPVSGATTASYSTTTAGNYSVQVYNGCYAKSLQVPVTVGPVPLATVTPSGATTFCQGNNVTLSAPTGLTYNWSNGSTTQSINVSQTGSYTVTVSSGGNCTAASTATAITVNAAPTASISAAGATTFCAGQSVTLSAPGGLNYSWSNNATTQSITAQQTGSYKVTVTDGNSCTAASSAVQVTVNALPTATISAGGATNFCTGGNVTLTATANASYHWSNNASTQSISANSTGSYVVTVTDANTCSNTASIAVTAYALPDNTVNANKPTTICPGDAVTLTGATGLNYAWSNGATTQSVSISNTSTLTLTVTDQHSCTATSSPVTITVSNNATAAITPSGPTSFCAGNSVMLTATNGTTYSWSDGSTSQSITITSSGSYTVSVTVSGSCTAVSNPQSVNIFQNPAAPAVTASGSTIFCTGESVSLSAPAGYNYMWSMSETTQQVNISAGGSYTVTITDGNGCTAASLATIVTVNALPVVSFSFADSAICSNAGPVLLIGGTPAGGNYEGTAVNGISFVPALATLGNNLVIYAYTDNNGCTNNATQNITVSSCLGVDNILVNNIVCIPNPSNGNFEVNWTAANIEVTDIKVFDLAGKLIYAVQPAQLNKQNIALQNVASACYILMLKTDQGPVFRKLVIER